VLVIYRLTSRHISHRAAISWLCLASLFFYGFWNPKYLVLILLSIIFNFLLAQKISTTKKKRAKIFVTFGIITNLSALIYFKYANFFIDTISAISSFELTVNTIILPLAISFFTFQQIAFLIDSYTTDETEKNFVDYILFICFFPQLIAGPIVHHKEMMPQFSRPQSNWKEDFNIGVAIICIGLFKKIVLADNFATVSSPIFISADNQEQLELGQSFLAMVFYSFQIYFDFSGYCDMAIGSARLFGIKLPQNFNSPYKATSIVDFWRRWHMTLSRFLRDYLYIALGGNRKGTGRRYVNLATTMVLGGLWHGAGWNFVIWGALHGAYLCINHLFHHFQRHSIAINNFANTRAFSLITWVITMTAVAVAWVFFKAQSFDGAWTILSNLVSAPLTELKHAYILLSKKQLLLLVTGTLVCIALPNCTEIFSRYKVTIGSPQVNSILTWNTGWLYSTIVAILASSALYQMIYMQNIISEFIYFQF
jgi:D-alanyl-lipoteichoic acid acyltransferase DltB (MBOAT superfamily)